MVWWNLDDSAPRAPTKKKGVGWLTLGEPEVALRGSWKSWTDQATVLLIFTQSSTTDQEKVPLYQDIFTVPSEQKSQAR